MIEGDRSLKHKLLSLREGEAIVVSTKGLANYHNGSTIMISPGARGLNSYHRLENGEKHRVLLRAYKELVLTLNCPPEGVMAEEMPGREFKVRFIRIENGGRLRRA